MRGVASSGYTLKGPPAAILILGTVCLGLVSAKIRMMEVWLSMWRASEGEACPAKRGTSRGLSLIEVLVAMGLLSLIMVLLIQVLIPGFKIWNRARAIADMEQQAMIAEERIARAVLGSIAGSISSVNTGSLKAISMLGHAGSDGQMGYKSDSGNPDWDRMEIFFVRPADKTLYQTFWNENPGPSLPHDFNDDDEPFKLTTAQLTSLCSNSGHQRRKLAEKVTDLTLRIRDRDEAGNLIPVDDRDERFVLTLTLASTVPGQTDIKTIQRSIVLVPRMRERE